MKGTRMTISEEFIWRNSHAQRSFPCLDLMKKMLQRDCYTRITVDRMINHKWLKITSFDSDIVMLCHEVITQFKNFPKYGRA